MLTRLRTAIAVPQTFTRGQLALAAMLLVAVGWIGQAQLTKPTLRAVFAG